MATQINTSSMANDFEAAKVLLDEWKWRHQHCWKSLNRYGLTAITIGLIPYAWLLKDSATPTAGTVNLFKEKFGDGVLVFPFMALLIAQAAIWIFASEYIRCRPVEAMYNKVLGTYSPNISAKETTKKWRVGVAQFTILIFGFLAVLLSFADICFLIYVADLRVNSIFIWWVFWIVISATMIGIIYFDWKLAEWSSKKVKERLDAQEKETRNGYKTVSAM
jgi:hypothetical protein